MDLKVFTEGQLYKVLLMPQAYDDLYGSTIRPKESGGPAKSGLVGKHESSGAKNRTDVAGLFTRITKYANTGKLKVPDHLNTEGNGFYAFKAYQLRAYWWRAGNTIIISHFAKKKRDELSPRDEAKMARSKKEFEENSHD